MSDTFEQLQQTGDSSSRNTDFDTTIVIRLATIGWTGTIGNVDFYKFDSLPTKELLENIKSDDFSGYSSQCIHIYKVVEEFTSDSNWDNSNHSIALDKNVVIEDDIKITVTTADTTRSLTYSSNQWKKDINNKVYLPLSVIGGYLQEADAEPRRGTSADIKAARSKTLILKLDHELRNDFTITIEYSGVIDAEGDVGDHEPLYDLYGIPKPTGADENTFYNAILLGDKSSPDVLPIATRYVGTSITLPSNDGSGFAAYVKVRSYTDIESFIDYTVYSPDYEEHIERARTYLVDTTDAESGETISGEHPHILDATYNRADKTNVEGTWNAITGVANIVTTPLSSSVPDYSQSDPKLYVGGFTLGSSGRCAGKGYYYDANIWYYWSDLDIRNAFAQLASINVPADFDLSPQYVGFDSRSGSFLYGFYEIPEGDQYVSPYIIVGGSNSYHYVDIYNVPIYSLQQIGRTVLTDSQEFLIKYRPKLCRWFNSLYFQNMQSKNQPDFYVVTPNSNANYNPTPYQVWQDITVTETNYLYHEIRIHINCSVNRTRGNIYLTEFSDLGDVAIQYDKENNQLNYVGLAPMESIDGTGTEAAVIKQIDASNAFQDVLNFYDVEYTDKQKTLEMLYRQSAFHIKWLTDHNYKIVYLGARYSVGYDAINEMYLILMKNTIRSSFRRTRQKKADFANVISFIDDYFVKSDGKGSPLTDMAADQQIELVPNSFELLDVNRGVFIVKHPTIAGYFRFLHDGGTL